MIVIYDNVLYRIYHLLDEHRLQLACSASKAYVAGMPATEPTATLTIRNVDPQLKERLRIRAARHGHSMEAELRQILRDTLEIGQTPELNLAEAIRRRFAPLGGVELQPHPPVAVQEPLSFEP